MIKRVLLGLSFISISISSMERSSDEEARAAKEEKTRLQYEASLEEHLENGDMFLVLSVVENKLPKLPGYKMSNEMKKKIIGDLEVKLTEQQYHQKEKGYMVKIIKKLDSGYQFSQDLRKKVREDIGSYINVHGKDENEVESIRSFLDYFDQSEHLEVAESSFEIKKYGPRITLVTAFLIATIAGFAFIDRARKKQLIAQYKVN